MNNWKKDMDTTAKLYNHAQVLYDEDNGLSFLQHMEAEQQSGQCKAEKMGVKMLQSNRQRQKGILKWTSFTPGRVQEEEIKKNELKPCLH